MYVRESRIELKRTSPMQQMLCAKCLWGLHIGMLKPTLSIRAFGDPLVRARKAGVCRIKTPTLCREGNKSRVGNGEKILTHYHVKSIMSIDLRLVNNKILCG